MFNYQSILTEFGEKAKKIPLRIFANVAKTDQFIQLEQIGLSRESQQKIDQLTKEVAELKETLFNFIAQNPNKNNITGGQDPPKPTLDEVKELAGEYGFFLMPKKQKKTEGADE
jgi:hypothetical protein